MREFPVAGNLAGSFLQFPVVPLRLGVTSRRNASALYAKVQVSGLAGAGNLTCPGQGIFLPPQGNYS
jgi:hypothetical protein